MDSSVTRIFAPFYSSAFTWNFALGMTQLLIPLYARELGYSGVAIGSLIAFPIIVQMIFNLIGGAWTDRHGGRNHVRRIVELRGPVRRADHDDRGARRLLAGELDTREPASRRARQLDGHAERNHELRPDRRHRRRRDDHRRLGLRRGLLDRGGDGRSLFCLGPRVPLRAPGPGEGAARHACDLPDAARPALDLLRRHVRLHLGAAVLLERLVLSDTADRAGVRLG